MCDKSIVLLYTTKLPKYLDFRPAYPILIQNPSKAPGVVFMWSTIWVECINLYHLNPLRVQWETRKVSPSWRKYVTFSESFVRVWVLLIFFGTLQLRFDFRSTICRILMFGKNRYMVFKWRKFSLFVLGSHWASGNPVGAPHSSLYY